MFLAPIIATTDGYVCATFGKHCAFIGLLGRHRTNGESPRNLRALRCETKPVDVSDEDLEALGGYIKSLK
jgi:hypothetical protein